MRIKIRKNGYFRGEKWVPFTWGNKISAANKENKEYYKKHGKIFVCEGCGKESNGYTKDQRFCSWKCGYKIKYINADPIIKKAITLSATIVFGKGKKEFFVNLVKNSLGKHCIYCGTMLLLENMSLDHIIPFGKSSLRMNPLVRKQLDKAENFQIICKKCNYMKGELPDEKYKKLLNFLETDLILKEYIIRKLGQSAVMWGFKRKL